MPGGEWHALTKANVVLDKARGQRNQAVRLGIRRGWERASTARVLSLMFGAAPVWAPYLFFGVQAKAKLTD